MKKNKIILSILLSVGIVILLNILSSRFFMRGDFTADNRYTLSNATKDILRNLEDPITVTAYFTKDLPPAIVQTKNEFKEMLIEYVNLSKGNLVYNFVSPNEDEKIKQELGQKGIAPRILNVREKDENVQKQVYLAATVQCGDKEEIIPLILPGASMEYDLSTAIKKVVVDEKPLVGIIQGHGEPAVSELMQAVKSLEVLYNVDEVHLSDSTHLEKYKTLVWIAPKDSISTYDFELVENYMNNGGNVYVAIDRVDGDLQTAQGSAVNTGLESWLLQKGIKVSDQFVIDNSCNNITVVQQQGYFKFQTQMKFPYLPIMSNFADHPISKGLEAVVMKFASPVEFTGDNTIQTKPLVFSSNLSGRLTAPIYFDIQKKWTKGDFSQPSIPVAYAFEGPLSLNPKSKMVVIGDGDFAINGSGQQAQQVNPDNINLMVNAVDWLSDDTGLIELRTKGITSRPLDQIEDGRKSFLKYLNFLLPILLIIIYGIFRSQRNRTIRYKRMQDNFVN